MISALKRIFRNSTTTTNNGSLILDNERLFDMQPPTSELCDAPEGVLDTRALLTLAVTRYSDHKDGVVLNDIPVAVFCVEHRIKQNHPDIADSIAMFDDWEARPFGPFSPTLHNQLLKMTTGDWATQHPLGGKQSSNFNGDRRTTLYEIDSSETFLDEWFQRTDLSCTDVQSVVDAFYLDHEHEFGFYRPGAMDEVVETDQKYRQMHTEY